jgi:seryl-tRNA synthetase
MMITPMPTVKVITNRKPAVEKALRLKRRIQALDAEVEALDAPKRAAREEAGAATKKARSALARAVRARNLQAKEVARLAGELEALQKQHAVAYAKLNKCDEAEFSAVRAHEAAVAVEETALPFDRHVAALLKDKEHVERRLSLHLARYPEANVPLTVPQPGDDDEDDGVDEDEEGVRLAATG